MKGLPSYPNPQLRGWRFAEGVPTPGLWYRIWRRSFQTLLAEPYKLRVFNRHYEPTSGSALYICNHQSFFDPPLMSLGLRRPMSYMARESLFRFSLFRKLIRSLNAFPVKRDTSDTGAIKEGLRRLKAGGQLVIFAEGTRTFDGRVMEFLPGVALLARRAADWVVPTVIDGAFEAWPRGQALPGGGQIVVAYCRPIPRDELDRLTDKEILDRARERIIAMQADVRRRQGKPAIAYNDPPNRPGDADA